MIDVQKAITILDQVVPHYLELMNQPEETVLQWIDHTFRDQSEQARSHLKDHWHSKEGRFDDFYLNLDDDNQRAVLEAFGIQVEPEPYPSSLERTTALINGKSPWTCHASESYLVFVFLRFAYNTSLAECQNIFLDQLARVEKSRVDLYGNGENWGKLYHYLLQQGLRDHRQTLIEHILNHA